MNAEFDIPANLGIGNHALVLRGVDIDNRPITLYQFFTVRSATSNDMDGDGIPDDEDNCQFIREWYDEQTGENICTVKAMSSDGLISSDPPVSAAPINNQPRPFNKTHHKHDILAATGISMYKGIIIPLLLLLSLAIGAILLYAREQHLIKRGLKQAPTKERHELTVAWLRRVGAALALLFVIVFAILEVSGFGGQARFYAKWIECGKKPLQSGIVFKNVVHYEQSPTISFLRFSPDYFCSEREAELKGYSASSRSYDYPHLTTEERRRQLLPRMKDEP